MSKPVRIGRSSPLDLLLRTAALCAAIAVGGGIAHWAMPKIFRSIPLGTFRIETILTALRREDLKPEIAVFGNSITASAIHATALTRELPGEPVVLNLSSPLQTVPEGYLLYQDLPRSIHVVVQTVTPWELIDREPFALNRFNTYYFFGYRPSTSTASVVTRVFGANASRMLQSSEASQTFRSRWVVGRLLDVSFWLNLQATLALEPSAHDVFFFGNNSQRLDDQTIDILLRGWTARLESPDRVAFERKRDLLRIAAEETNRAGRRLVVFVPPLHPEIRRALKPPLSRWFDELVATPGAATVLDFRDSEDDPSFRDGMHLKAEAAERTTRGIAERLLAAGVWSPSPIPVAEPSRP